MTTSLKTMSLEFSRVIPAPPTEVFRAWLDPTFEGTPWTDAAKLILNTKVDGLYYWLSVSPTGLAKPHYGRFTIIDEPSKIQYTWMSPHTRGLESLVTVTLQPSGHATLLHLRHENLPDDDYGRGHQEGWITLANRFADRLSP